MGGIQCQAVEWLDTGHAEAGDAVLQLSALRATLVPPHDQGTGWALRHGEAFSLLVRPTVNPVR